jgi:deoxyribose-phosphate aldolase
VRWPTPSAIVEAGGQEVDVVLPYARCGRRDRCRRGRFLAVRAPASRPLTLKVILESGELPTGADPPRQPAGSWTRAPTSSRPAPARRRSGATPAAAAVMLHAIAAAARLTTQVGFKASRRHPHRGRAGRLHRAGARIAGRGRLERPQRLRIGASGLLDDIHAAAEIIRTKRDGGALSAAQIQAFVAGLASTGADRWSDARPPRWRWPSCCAAWTPPRRWR